EATPYWFLLIHYNILTGFSASTPLCSRNKPLKPISFFVNFKKALFLQTTEPLKPSGKSCLYNPGFKFPKTIGVFDLKRLICFVILCSQ
ncbi:TPA: hypothetical protein ACKUJQ_001898, partial [Neisseria gonorrhoeae]|uniref:hypothetical protein n=1 Tax=Neisseria gonorrhoeae TaxID=485 RepID=UPI0019D71DBB